MLEILTHTWHRETQGLEQTCSSGSSSNSSSPKSQLVFNPEDLKQKSQLCRSFMESGMCPYQNRCKFAHGCHELLKNNQANVKYKTKECEHFRKNLTCQYGTRCNFIHNHAKIDPIPEARTDLPLRLARANGKHTSRLMRILQGSQI